MKNKYFYLDNFKGLKGIILESRGGAKGTKNVKNINYKHLLIYILEKLKANQKESIQIYVASNNPSYNTLEDRKLVIDNNDTFNFSSLDLEEFIPKLNKAIKLSGQKGSEKGGNSTKRLFFYDSTNTLDLLYKNEDVKVLNSFGIKDRFLEYIKNFSYSFDKKPDPKKLQNELLNFLITKFNNYQWETEYQFDKNKKDRFDIYGKFKDHHIIIELDPHRADSIAKKFVSRTALTKTEKTTYIAFLYKGKKTMNVSESKKYLTYCEEIINLLNSDKIEPNKEFVGYLHFKY